MEFSYCLKKPCWYQCFRRYCDIAQVQLKIVYGRPIGILGEKKHLNSLKTDGSKLIRT